jgi:hypothetical protein
VGTESQSFLAALWSLSVGTNLGVCFTMIGAATAGLARAEWGGVVAAV